MSPACGIAVAGLGGDEETFVWDGVTGHVCVAGCLYTYGLEPNSAVKSGGLGVFTGTVWPDGDGGIPPADQAER